MVRSHSVPVRILQLTAGFILAIVVGLLLVKGGEVILKPTVYTAARDPSWPGLRIHTYDVSLTVMGDELLQRIGEMKGFQIKPVATNSRQLWEGLRNGSWDIIYTTVTPTEQLQKLYTFSDPYYLIGPVLIVRFSSTFQSIDDLKNGRIGIARDNPGFYGLVANRGILINPFDDVAKAVEAVLDGRIDGVIAPMDQARLYSAGAYRDRLKVAGAPLNNEGFRIAVLKNGHEDLIADFNEGLQEHIRSSDFRGLLQKWGVPAAGSPPPIEN